MSYAQEFETVDLVLASLAETRGVDAFALSLIKCERQVRRLLTHIVFQFPCFGNADISALRSTLSNNRKVYFEGFICGFDAIYPRSIKYLIGPSYDELRSRLDEAIYFRNKIFHGQLTSSTLSRNDLFGYVADIRSWCKFLAEGALAEIGYDGFLRDSFKKSKIGNISKKYLVQFSGIASYEQFIRQCMQR